MSPNRTLSMAAAAAALLLAGGAHAQRQVNASHDAASTGTVEIQMNAGTLRVIGWSRGEVQVTGTLSRDADRVVLDGSGRSVEVRVEGRNGRGGPANLEIRVPAGSSLEVVTGPAPLTISGVTGTVEAASQGGATTITGSPRSVDVSAAGGAVSVDVQTDELSISAMAGAVRVAGTVRQRAEISAMAGSVDMTGSVGEAEISALSGNVRVANVTGGRVEISAVSGDVTVSGTRLRGTVSSVSGNIIASGTLGGALTLESHSGNVELRLPANTGADVDVTSWSGELDSDWRLSRESRHEWHGSLGRGGHSLSITTFSGNVKLSRR
jgi:DUF4097 and DUF4098 domain-containing protein YvlB